MRLSLTDYREISERGVTPQRVTAAPVISWTSNAVPVTQLIVFAHAGNSHVVISTASAGQADFHDLQSRLQAILQSFKLG